jgi:cytidylate kinase
MVCIIALSGRSKVGKTTLGKMLATALEVPFASFGDYIRKEAYRLGLENLSSRRLQDLGTETVARDIKGFCKAVLQEAGFVAGRGLVLDGIRHMAALKAIEEVARQPVKLIYLDSSLADRMKRSGLTARKLQEIDSHSVEHDQSLLKSAADIVITTSADVHACFQTLQDWTIQFCG